MERDHPDDRNGGGKRGTFDRDPLPDPVSAEGGEDHRSRPTWRGLLFAVIAAVVLSVAATLILGGGYGLTGQAARQGCGQASPCCPPADGR